MLFFLFDRRGGADSLMTTAAKRLPAPHRKRRDPIWELFSSVKLTIPLVLLWAVTSIVGTVVKQFPSAQDLQALYTPTQIEWLQRLGFFDAYHSWWYQLILVLLATNLIVCSIERIPGVLRVIRNPRERLNETAWSNMPMCRTFRVEGATAAPAAETLSGAVAKEFGRPQEFEVAGERHIFAEAGSYSRLAPYLVHVSLLVIFAGGMLGSAFGYRGSMLIFTGESSNTVRLFQHEDDDSKAVRLPNLSLRCDDFDVKFYPDGTPRDFKSDLTLVDDDGAELHKTVLRVNHPMKWDGVRFYQASYGQSTKVTLEMYPGGLEYASGGGPPALDGLGDFAPKLRRMVEGAAPT
ncbi:MAG: cytochrome c biogenesis protein ResB, partial [Candidatus Methylomirabilis sp.]|nr:cytochrome c biogenesis protein ResB [Deltaproteobacteria bacterium]